MGNEIGEQRKHSTRTTLRKRVPCFCSQEQFPVDDMVHSSESLANKDYIIDVCSPETGQPTRKPDTGNIEEAEASLRENGSLNYEEARALLGRYEYQKGNIEAALLVLEGIDIASITPKMKIALSSVGETHRRRSQKYAAQPMSINAVSLLFEAIFLKAKSLQALRRYKEAAQPCSIILEIVESSSSAGFPGIFGADSKMQETFSKAVELLPELWKLADCPKEAMLSYRRALLHSWNLDVQTTAKIQKEFAIFLLYSGVEPVPINLRSQMDSSFVPKNNIEEAILLLIILLRKVSLKRIKWDPSFLDHLTFALSISGGLGALASQVEELLPGVIDKQEMYYILAICYQGEGDKLDALELWKRLLKNGTEDSTYLQALLLGSKICSYDLNYVEDGISFARRAVEISTGRCDLLMGVAKYTLGISLSASCRSVVISDKGRVERQSEALQSLEKACQMTKMKDPDIVYHLSLENAEQRNFEPALQHAKHLVKLEGGSNLRGWILLARILSAQKRFSDAETMVDAALHQSGVWDQGELLRTKAKLQFAQDLTKEGIETYSRILALVQLQHKSFGSGMKLKNIRDDIKELELVTWHDLASIYTRLTRWHDAELCIVKSDAICAFSALRWHATGVLHEARSNHKEALKAYKVSLEIDPTHIPSLVSMAALLKKIGCQSLAIIRTFLTEALRHDRTNAHAWFCLGLLYKDEGNSLEAAECFQAASLLEETEPVEPFR